MMETRSKIEKILSEIEGHSQESGNSDKKSMKEVLNILLETNNSGEIQCQYESLQNDREYYIDMDELSKCKEKNNVLHHIEYYHDITNRRKIVGRVITYFRRGIRRIFRFLFNPILEEQNNFNSSITASINALYNNEIVTNEFIKNHHEVQDINQQLQDVVAELLNTKMNKLQHSVNYKLEEQQERLIEFQEKIKEQQKEIMEQKQQIIECSTNLLNCNKINKLKEMEILNIKREIVELKSVLEHEILQVEMNFLAVVKQNKICINDERTFNILETKKPCIKQDYVNMDYFKFENYFRGKRSQIKKDQEQYVNYYLGKGEIVDLGCGRGEFLELLTNKGIKVTGVDIYEDFVDYCNIKQLTAVKEDVISYLEKLDNESLGGIFASQLIEHLELWQVICLCKLAYEKLKPGCCIIMETPNPRSLSIYTNAFYADPSHNKPVHPETMEFLLKEAGFYNIEVINTENSKPEYKFPILDGSNINNLAEFNDGINLLSDIMFGSQDYAIIATKY